MGLTIRLTRTGAKKKPFYRVVVADSRKPRDGRIVEQVGTYNPKAVDNKVTLKEDKVKYWLKQGARPSLTVRSFLKVKGIE